MSTTSGNPACSEDAISYSSMGGISLNRSLLNPSNRFGQMNSTKFSLTPTLMLKIGVTLIGLACLSAIAWAAISSRAAHREDGKEGHVSIDTIQTEKLTNVESQVKGMMKKYDKLLRKLEDKLDEHIGHFVSSKLINSKEVNPEDLDIFTESIEIFQTRITNLEDQVEILTRNATKNPSSAHTDSINVSLLNQFINRTRVNGRLIAGLAGDLTQIASWRKQVDGKLNDLKPPSTTGSVMVLPDLTSFTNQLNMLQSDVDALKSKAGQKSAKNCEDYFDNGLTSSGSFMIDPDDDGPLAPFQVKCDFDTKSTKIYHDKMGQQEISNCTELDCYSLELTYQASMDQIITLIDASQSCSQFIQFDCFLSKLTTIGSWSDRFGARQTYFSGANYGQKICDCATQTPSNCTTFGIENYCNCDLKDPLDRFDSGYITNKTALPIQSFHYGMMYLPTQKASVTIGPLECKGKTSQEFNGGSCQSLKMQGRPSGYYLLDTSNGTSNLINSKKPVLHVSMCNMSMSMTDPNFQVDLGFVTLFSGSVHVIVIITKGHRVIMGERIPFDKTVMDPSNSFTLQNSTFVAPWDGSFSFSKHRFRCTSNDRDLYGYINGEPSQSFEIRTTDTAKYLSSGQFVVIMRKDSSITLGCTETDPCTLTIKGEQ